ncbi:MAG: SUMF1/EgtB/PvdO family nonheme iron enzyme [Bdellovibrionales bacterium]|nr:SUMF1/EgtB/PvdO family nonheme iron enzyme [Bdellovibrionales bacterium]
MQAVSLSLRERGYKLGVPEDVGDHNGLSNMDTTRHYVAQEVVPKLTQRLTTFVPHSHQYNFENTYSRAYDKLNVKIYEPISIDKDTEIKQGKEYQSFIAAKSLDKSNLIQDLLNLKNSQDPQDVLIFVYSGQVVAQLEKLGLFSVKEFEKDLMSILERKELPFNIRKQAVFEVLLIKSEQNQNELGLDFKNFDEQEKTQISSEIRQWSKSSDKRRKKFADSLNDKWSEAVAKSDIKTLESFSALKLFDINSRNESGFSILLIAIHTDQKAVVEWLIENPKLDLNHKDDLGFTDVEQARLLGKNEMADYIESKRPESRSRRFEVKERNDDGTPIISSVKIPAGTFRMGNKEKVTVTLTKPFEMMSVQTTQKMWQGVVELANQYLTGSQNEALRFLDLSPSKFKGDQNPVEQVSHDQVIIWIESLNALSGMNNPEIQSKLKELFSSQHYLGKKYRLPTEAEWEYVARMRGLSTGDYAHGNTDKNLAEYAWFGKNSGNTTHPVGLKKPIMFNGKPIYDTHGNVWEWLADWYGNNLPGGIDPQDAANSSSRVIRGGSWYNGAGYLRSGGRFNYDPGNRDSNVGFRLVSDIP